MTLQLVVTLVFGFGVVTVAVIALMNTASLRLHDLYQQVEPENKDGKQIRPQYQFVYGTDEAQTLRNALAELPPRLGAAAVLSIILLTAMHLVVSQLDVKTSILSADGVITWFAVGSYVCRVVYIATARSRDLYDVMQDF